MRVQVRKRPRIASTSTSAGARCAAASGWRALQRSSPASASSLPAARPISIERTASAPGGATAARAAARPACLRYCGGHGASPWPSRSWRADSSSRRVERARAASSMPAWRSPSVGEPRRHRGEREVARLARVDLVPRERRRDARVRRRPHRVRAGDRAVLRVLVVVEEHAVALLLPPLAGRERRARAARPRARARARRAGPRRTSTRLDAHVDVDAARSRRLRPADEPEVGERGLHDARDLAQLVPGDAGHRIEIDAQLVGVIEILGAHRVRVQLEAGEVGHPRQRGRVARHDLLRGAAGRKAAAPRPRPTAAATAARASGRRTRRRCRSGSGRARSAVRPRRAARRRRRPGSSARDRAW